LLCALVQVDIVNRGFGGYNTRWAKVFLNDVLAGCTPDNTKLVTIWFGANDAARPDGPP
jgi:isoamyl acetate esterase